MWNLTSLLTLLLFVTCVVANQQPDSELQAFLAWFTENGGTANGVSVAYFPGMGNGIQATKTLSSETEILRIPANYIFTYEAMKVSADDGVKALAFAMSNADIALACWVLLEKYRGQESFFAPYIDSLPEHVPAAMHFNSTELSLLQEPSFAKGVVDQQTQLTRDFQRVVEIVHRQSSDPSFSLLKDNLSLNDFKWATSIINSRGLRFRGQIHLAPFADFFNYAPHDDIRVASNGEHFLQHHVLQKDGSLVVSLDRVCLKGEQCLEDYGDNPNGIYLQYHGFVPYNNPLHCLRVTIGTASSILGEKLKPAAVNLIKRLQLDRSGLGECLTHTASFSRYILSYLAIAAMDEIDLKQCETALAERKVMAGCRFTEAATALSLLKQHSFQPQTTSAHDSKWMERQLSPFQQRVVNFSQLLLSKSIVDSFLFQGSIDEDQDMIAMLSTNAEQDRHVEYTILALRYRLANKQLCQTLAVAHAISLPFMPNTAASPLSSASNKAKSKIVGVTSSSGSSGVSVEEEQDDVEDKQETSSFTSSVQENNLQAKLSRFNAWYMTAASSSSSSASNAPNKISAAMIPGFRIGTIATEPIKAEENYVSVPAEVIMDSEKAFLYSGVAELLQALSLRYSTRDDFHELLFFLLHEMFILAQDSQFWPYLSLLPGTKDMDIPLFWSHDEIHKRLSPSFLGPQATSYQQRTLRRFEFMQNITEVQTFFAKHKDKQVMTQENYFWATAILDSRSIWWDSRRHLVPMLDFINCAEQVGREGRVHSTEMDAARRFAVTKAGADFAPGAQVFENYGQANHIYFQYHGFALRNNSHDCIAFELTLTPQEFEVAVSNGGVGYLEQLGLSKTQRRWRGCLTLPINEPLWNILGLTVPKQKLVQDSKGWKLPNKPTLVTAKKLRKIFKDRLQLYAKDQCNKAQDGGMLERFLCEEKEMINKIMLYLRNVIADLTEKEEEAEKEKEL